MRRRVRLDNLRSHDPITLEVVVQDPLRRPLVQLHPATVVDLVALGEVEALPRSLHRALEAFTARVGRELADLPDIGLTELLDDLDAIPADQVSAGFRQLIQGELDRDARPQRQQERMGALLERWSEVEPTPIEVSSHQARIERAAAKPAPVERPRRGAAVASDTPRRKAAGSAQPQGRRLDLGGGGMDEARARWIRDAALERLTMATDQGLSEQVLIAGLRHRARNEFPDLAPPQITSVLKEMASQGLVRQSAGRWRRVGRGW